MGNYFWSLWSTNTLTNKLWTMECRWIKTSLMAGSNSHWKRYSNHNLMANWNQRTEVLKNMYMLLIKCSTLLLFILQMCCTCVLPHCFFIAVSVTSCSVYVKENNAYKRRILLICREETVWSVSLVFLFCLSTLLI